MTLSCASGRSPLFRGQKCLARDSIVRRGWRTRTTGAALVSFDDPRKAARGQSPRFPQPIQRAIAASQRCRQQRRTTSPRFPFSGAQATSSMARFWGCQAPSTKSAQRAFLRFFRRAAAAPLSARSSTSSNKSTWSQETAPSLPVTSWPTSRPRRRRSVARLRVPDPMAPRTAIAGPAPGTSRAGNDAIARAYRNAAKRPRPNSRRDRRRSGHPCFFTGRGSSSALVSSSPLASSFSSSSSLGMTRKGSGAGSPSIRRPGGTPGTPPITGSHFGWPTGYTFRSSFGTGGFQGIDIAFLQRREAAGYEGYRFLKTSCRRTNCV
mmetsp:Transcript_20902/g.67326  ORF Transcript_20902/g.67326 Transcript_20902/m.67326 type:complete len:322 (+) Transcript_20902:647-1612(+)